MRNESDQPTDKFHQRLMKKIGEGMIEGIKLATGKDVESIMKRVDRERELHPELKDQPALLADRLIEKKQWYAAAASFAYGFGGWFTLAPNVAHIWRIHGRLVLAVAYVYGYHLHDPEIKDDIAVCFALSSSNALMKNLVSELGIQGAKKAMLSKIGKEIIKSLPRRIVTIAGRKSILNVAKVLPLVASIIGGVIDFFSTKGIGKAAKAYYA